MNDPALHFFPLTLKPPSQRRAADRCRHELGPTLLHMGPSFDTAGIVDAFWNLDENLGRENINDGTTATVLLVDKTQAGCAGAKGELRCQLAWVGDTSAVAIDMLQPRSHAAAVLHATSDHKATSPPEVKRLNQEWDVRRAIEQGRKQAGIPKSPRAVTSSASTSATTESSCTADASSKFMPRMHKRQSSHCEGSFSVRERDEHACSAHTCCSLPTSFSAIWS